MKKDFMLCFLMLAFVLAFPQRKSKIIYAPPVVTPEKEKKGEGVSLSPPPPLSEMQNNISLNSGTAGNVVGSFLSEEEIIQNLNKPFRRDTFPKKVQKFLEKAEKEIIAKIGKEDFDGYLRINREYVSRLDRQYRRNHSLKGYSLGEINIEYIVVYQSFISGNITVKMDTMGKISAKNKKKLHYELAAYKELFEGKLKVSPAQVVQTVFGNRDPYTVYHLYLFHEKATYPRLKPDASSIYKQPKIWWYIWQNGCETCKEAEIDANNLENRIVKMVNRF